MTNYTHLIEKERLEIYKLQKNNFTVNIIAQKLKRDKGTISRELTRNSYHSIGYLPDTAHVIAQKRKHILQFKIDRYPKLKEFIFNKLNAKWSPDVIAAKSKEFTSVKISAESIYQYCYHQKNKELRWYCLLSSKRPKRLHAHARKKRKVLIPQRTSIHERADSVNKRLEIGHFEADLTFAKGNQSVNLLVITERVSKMSFLIKNNSKKATEVGKNQFNIFAKIPESMRKSVTFDNGLEFIHHHLLKDFLNMKTYFCDPHSPWQKGQVEKTNAMLHRFIPKKASLSTIDEHALIEIQNKFNNIPRKILGYKTPAELFNQFLEGVALQT